MKPVTKDNRVDFRIGSEQKDVIARAASLIGLTMSDFISSSAYLQALDILQKHDNTIRIPRDDFDRFVAALEADKEPSPVAVSEAAEYARGHVEGDKYKW